MKQTVRRRTTKKGLTNTEKLIVAGGIVAGGLAIWKYVIKPMQSPGTGSTGTLPETTPAPAPLPAPAPAPEPAPTPSANVQFNGDKVLRLNSAPSPELKYSKMAFNSMVILARRRKTDTGLSNYLQTRLETISQLPLLDLNTKFGKETEKVAKVIMGKKDFTYNAVKLQKITLWNAVGLPNPY